MKAFALISGGLDSILAARVVRDEGIEIIPLNFKIPFCVRSKTPFDSKRIHILVRDNLGLDLKTIDISEAFLKLLENPRYGFGSNMNPCIDCKMLMLSKAKELMKDFNTAFVVTGEVLGQRPMSQHKAALQLIGKRSGLEDLVLRPLSAKLLPETIPEKAGWVNRNKLFDFNGRTRKPQMELAKKIGISDYPNPAGGCLLTDPEFSKRLKELVEYQELNLDNIELLKIGRHFRISKDTKLIVGRNERENECLINLARQKDYLFMPDKTAGPTSLGRGLFSESLIELSCAITGRYCDLNGTRNVEIAYRRFPDSDAKIREVSPIQETDLQKLRV
jgi:tRNA U34 2-thiouridine synthase MnmA/TrmU